MHVERELKVSAEAFFKELSYSVQQDIYASANQKVKQTQIQPGFTYEKTLNNKVGKKNKVTVKILAMKSPCLYQAEFVSRDGKNTISYRIEKKSADTLRVYYDEDFKGASVAKGLNAKVMRIFYSFNSKKRINKLLSNIESYIIQNR